MILFVEGVEKKGGGKAKEKNVRATMGGGEREREQHKPFIMYLSASSTAADHPPTHHHALLLDVRTLSLLLQRNHHQHRRCIYYRRMTMALSALRRSLPPHEDVTEWTEEWRGLVRSFLDGSSRAVGRRTKEERWTLGERGDVGGGGDHDDANLVQELQRMAAVLQRLKSLVGQSLPLIISLIAHATAPVLTEISRGYFVPFLTVALGCLGRVHSLLTRLGREVASVLRETVPRLRWFHEEGRKTRKTKHSIRDLSGIVDWKLLEDLVMTPFVVEDAGGIFKGRKRQLTLNNEWNDLMEHFVDVSQDELTKNINEYVKRKRWSDAVSRFGLGKFVLGSNTSTPPLDKNEQGLQEDLCVEREDSAFEDDREAQYPARELETNVTCGDAGELVNIHQSCVSSTQSKALVGVLDENMARIEKERMKRNIDTPSSKASAPEKKKKKKKRGQTSIDKLMGDNDEKRLRHYPVDGAKSTQNNTFDVAIAVLNEPEPHVAHTNRRNKSIAESTIIDKNGSAIMPPQSVGTDECPNTPPKKLKTGKKKKRKSTSVIDDIFKR